MINIKKIECIIEDKEGKQTKRTIYINISQIVTIEELSIAKITQIRVTNNETFIIDKGIDEVGKDLGIQIPL